MKRIIDVTKVKLKPSEVLVEVFFEKSLIIKPGQDDTNSDFDYATILAKGSDVRTYEVGDIVLDAKPGKAFNIEINGIKHTYSIMQAFNMDWVVSPDNFDFTKGKKNNTKIVQ